MKKVYLLLIAVAALAAGCSGVGESGLVATVSALETQSASQEEWVSYQATQIGSQQMVINDLTTQVAQLPRQTSEVTGSVLIHGGACCMGSTAGDTISVDVAFDARSGSGEVVEMRVVVARSKVATEALEDSVWEPFVQAREFPVEVPSAWSSFWVVVQYRDSGGNT
ncbi:MAG: hypothetical protein P8046_10720, partial [Anaerolineales bacterium]